MEESETYSIYILLCSNGTYYTGMSSNLEQRLQAHMTGEGAFHTKCHRPVKLMYSISGIETKFLAAKGEKYIKSLVRAKKEKIIHGDKKMLALLYKRIFPSRDEP